MPSIAGAVYTVLVAVNCNLFFMITGALLLPVTQPGKVFAKRRLWAILPPLAVWTVVYLLEHAFLLHNFTPRLLTSILFHPVEGLLWYVYVLLVIYVTLPLVSKCIAAIGKRGVEVVLVLWVLSSFIPYQHGLFMEASQYSHNMFGAFANYYGYVLLGYYLHRYGLPLFTRAQGWKWGLLLDIGIVAMPLLFVIQGQIFYQQRARSHKAHIPPKDIPKLRQLIQAGAAQCTAELCQPLLTGQQFAVFIPLICHGAEFV
jgi:surface polysaccharide O-acyltransferase-like enzyme